MLVLTVASEGATCWCRDHVAAFGQEGPTGLCPSKTPTSRRENSRFYVIAVSTSSPSPPACSPPPLEWGFLVGVGWGWVGGLGGFSKGNQNLSFGRLQQPPIDPRAEIFFTSQLFLPFYKKGRYGCLPPSYEPWCSSPRPTCSYFVFGELPSPMEAGLAARRALVPSRVNFSYVPTSGFAAAA